MLSDNITQKLNGNTGTSIQVAGDLHLGMDAQKCTELFQMLMQENFPKLVDEAAEKVANNIKQLEQAFVDGIAQNRGSIELGKLAEPDVQSVIFAALDATAKKGGKINIGLLAELLCKRLEKDMIDFDELCIESAINIIPRLTNKLLRVLPSVYCMKDIVPTLEADLIDMRYSWIEHNFLDPLSDVDREKMVFIASVGVGSHLGITVSDNETFDRMKQFYATKSINIDSARFPNMYSACQKYDTFRRIAGTLTLSPAGKLIGDMIYSQDFAKYSRHIV